jgi:hypothetical protein
MSNNHHPYHSLVNCTTNPYSTIVIRTRFSCVRADANNVSKQAQWLRMMMMTSTLMGYRHLNAHRRWWLLVDSMRPATAVPVACATSLMTWRLAATTRNFSLNNPNTNTDINTNLGHHRHHPLVILHTKRSHHHQADSISTTTTTTTTTLLPLLLVIVVAVVVAFINMSGTLNNRHQRGHHLPP